jgi:hypothetical protein
MYRVSIYFTNGSTAAHSFRSFIDARDFYRNNISYSGGRVQRVTVTEPGCAPRTVWDASWDDYSKYRGLD